MLTTTATYSRTRVLVTLALLSSIAYVLWAVGRVPVLSAGPLTLRYDPKDIVIAFAGFIFGPMAAFAISIVVSFVQMVTLSETGPIGFVMNVISTCAFICPAAYIYNKRKTLQSAVVGLAFGVVFMTAVMILWNYIMTPIFMGVPRQAVVALLLPLFLPFNLISGGINASLTLLLYKPLIKALRKSGMIPEREGGPASSKRVSLGVLLVAGLVLASCILVILVFQGVI